MSDVSGGLAVRLAVNWLSARTCDRASREAFRDTLRDSRGTCPEAAEEAPCGTRHRRRGTEARRLAADVADGTPGASVEQRAEATGGEAPPPSGYRESPPKSAKSRRSVPLTKGSVNALRAHQARQAAQRLAIGAAWPDLGFVFTNDEGRPLDGHNFLRRSFRPLLARAELPPIRLHDLRHSAASLMLERGVHPKVVQEVLGHAQIGVTLDTYSHVAPSMARDASAAVEEAIASEDARTALPTLVASTAIKVPAPAYPGHHGDYGRPPRVRQAPR